MLIYFAGVPIKISPNLKRTFSMDNYAIICGDFGCVWDDNPMDCYWLNWLEEKSCSSLEIMKASSFCPSMP